MGTSNLISPKSQLWLGQTSSRACRQDAQELTATALAVAQARVSGKGASAMGPGQGGNPGADTGPATGQGLAPEAVAGATAAGMELELAAALVAVCQVATNSLEVLKCLAACQAVDPAPACSVVACHASLASLWLQ